MYSRCFALLFAILLSACNSSSEPPNRVEFEDVTMTFFRSFAPETYVFRSQVELERAWVAAPFQVYPIGIILEEPPMPTYDFSEKTVVGLSLGIGKWCFKPRFTEMFSTGNDLFVHYVVPTTGTLACMKDGPLIAFALVPIVRGNVEFLQD